MMHIIAPVTIGIVGLSLAAQGDDRQRVAWPNRSGIASISGGPPEAPIELRVSRRTAGAIDSLVWNGKQFVNASDHGREFQSASYYDHKGACYNPTEAGSAADGSGTESTSQLLSLTVNTDSLTTRTRMAFWAGLGNSECPQPAVSSTLSDDVLTKVVRINKNGVLNEISYDVTFSVGQPHSYAIFEALTGYMPLDFHNFWIFDPERNQITRESNEQGSQTLPIIVSTDNGLYAIGVVGESATDTAENAATGTPPMRPIYGRWDFTQPKMGAPTVKWNCVFATKSRVGASNYRFKVHIVVGTLDTVQVGLRTLCSTLTLDTCRTR